MIGKVLLSFRVLYCKFTAQITTPEEFGKAYDAVASTYSLWETHMGNFNDFILPEKSDLKDGMKILDLACGTGNISRKILEGSDAKFALDAVDVSAGMLKVFRENIEDPRVHVLQQDILSFLKGKTEMYDHIICGWALAYVHPRQFFNLAFKALKKGGMLRVIANGADSASLIEPALLSVLEHSPQQLKKYACLTEHLPQNVNQLLQWAKTPHTHVELSGEGVETFMFSTAREYLAWQEQTGAIAGISKMFHSYDQVRLELLSEISHRVNEDGKLPGRHPFVYAVWQKD